MRLKNVGLSVAKFYNASAVQKALGEDFRKVGTAAIGVGLVAYFIPQVNAPLSAPLFLGLVGSTMWGMGLVFTHYGQLRAERESEEKDTKQQEKTNG